jgi:chromate transporter
MIPDEPHNNAAPDVKTPDVKTQGAVAAAPAVAAKAPAAAAAAARPAATVRLRDLFQVFALIGVTSFGGGLSGWMFREVVERRQWLTSQDFLTGLSLARAMPGINVMNLSIWIGYHLRKGLGAVAAAVGVIVPPLFIVILCAMAYRRWSDSLTVHQVLIGVTAAAMGLSLSMVLKSLRPAITGPFYAIIAVLLFVTIGLLHWPMLPVVGVLAPASVAWSFLRDGADDASQDREPAQ